MAKKLKKKTVDVASDVLSAPARAYHAVRGDKLDEKRTLAMVKSVRRAGPIDKINLTNAYIGAASEALSRKKKLKRLSDVRESVKQYRKDTGYVPRSLMRKNKYDE